MAPYIAGRRMIGRRVQPGGGKSQPHGGRTRLCPPGRKGRGRDIRAQVTVLGLEPSAQCVRLVTQSGEILADQVGTGLGAWLSEQAATLGLRLPIAIEPVQVAATEPVEPLVEHLVYYAGAPYPETGPCGPC